VRLNLAFVLLLVTASTAISVVWQSFSAATGGDLVASLVVAAGVLSGLAAGVLLGRIIVKVSAARRATRES
jgi:membrane associated rhomboid family serine protease